MSSLHDEVFAISPDVRYVAVAHGQQVDVRSRPGLRHASGNDSDRYEELLVNPALLVLTTQRGNIDCGGLRYLIVGGCSSFGVRGKATLSDWPWVVPG